jgi:hypothetical protein
MERRWAIVENGVVVNVAVWDGEAPWGAEGQAAVEDIEGVAFPGMRYEGGAFITPEPPQPEPLVLEDYRRAVQGHLDATAQERQYDNAVSLATYVTSGHPQWAAEAKAFVSWRDEVWAYALGELGKVMTGEREIPSIEDFIGELPRLTWPGGGADT